MKMTKMMFVPKRENETVQVSLDEALTKIAEIRTLMGPLEAQEKNLLEVVKTAMKEKGETKHTSPEGITATFVTSQRSEVNKGLAKEICGPRWAEVLNFKTVVSFTVKVPG
jgi:hypothetical protein